jgi:hypothetical protein
MTKSLQQEIVKDIYGNFLSNNKLFSRCFSKKFIKEIALYFKEVNYAPEEMIFQ